MAFGSDRRNRPASRCAVLFGGTGFVGGFFARYLVDNGHFEKVYLVDRQPVTALSNAWRQAQLTHHPGLSVVVADVREPIDWMPPEPVTLVANFVALPAGYDRDTQAQYDTNLRGAEQVCAWATRARCRRMIFLSSASPYGLASQGGAEDALPMPVTPCGASKLVAEYIHRLWQAEQPSRRLVIARPARVFGPGGTDDISWLVRAVVQGYFCYPGNRQVTLSGLYVRELCAALWWALERPARVGDDVILFNASLASASTLADYVEAIQGAAGRRRRVATLPGHLLVAMATLAELAARPFGTAPAFGSACLRRLAVATENHPAWLIAQGYPFQYSLASAFVDWRALCPEEWEG